jgi:hypothetical protein
VETSVFGSEFCALKTATEKIIALSYKLQMMGVPLEDPTFVCVDNMSVVYNSSILHNLFWRSRIRSLITLSVNVQQPVLFRLIMNLQILTLLIFVPKHRLVQKDMNCVQRFFIEVGCACRAKVS